MDSFVLALDQGTTSSRSIVFSRDGRVVSCAQQEFPQVFPSPGHVEHDPQAIWQSQLQTAREAIQKAGIQPQQIAALGVANQRETTLVWERATGRPVCNAIVWQSRISAPICERLKRDGAEPLIRERTGLVLDPYFSASKLTYLLERDTELKARAERGELAFGTVDSWLAWQLTGGRQHVTDVSNASRTLLMNIHTLDWDAELLELFGVPSAMMPKIVSSSDIIDKTDSAWLGAPIPLAGIVGDQQAATFGQACFEPGEAKNTYGTGAFLLVNTGERAVASEFGLLTTVGWRVDGKVTYCMEGSVFVAGAVVQWLRDGLGLIAKSSDVESLAAQVEDSGGVYFVPALVGLGAPHWDPYARGTIVGLSRGTTAAHLARAALESMAYQTRDLIEAMQQDMRQPLRVMKADGGAASNNLLMQFQSDILNIPVQRPEVAETTALGAAYLAGLAVGYWNGLEDVRANWALDRQFEPSMDAQLREARYRNWKRAVQRSLRWEAEDA